MMASQESADVSVDNKWYLQPMFRQFWNHYNDCNKWLEQLGHKVVPFSGDMMDSECQTQAEVSARAGHSTQHPMDALEAIDGNECHDEDTEDMDILADIEDEDISDEYLDFVMKTRKHQTERKKWKEKRLRISSRIEYIDASRMDSFSRKSVAPKAAPNKSSIKGRHGLDANDSLNAKSAHELKREKMYELYGDDYNVIQGMETAIQLNFDRLCDIHQPKFWPIMSVRMTSIIP